MNGVKRRRRNLTFPLVLSLSKDGCTWFDRLTMSGAWGLEKAVELQAGYLAVRGHVHVHRPRAGGQSRQRLDAAGQRVQEPRSH